MKRKLLFCILFTVLLSFAGTQYGFCQRHVTYKGICLNGNVEKVKKEMEKKGWKHFQKYNGFENSISTTEELPPGYIPTSVEIIFSTKSHTVSSMIFVLRDENQDSLYNHLFHELVSTYHHPNSYTEDGTTYFIVKNKKNKNIGLVLLKKHYKYDVAVLIVDFKNHFKAIKEGGRYLEEFYTNLATLSH